jgi:cytochrome b
VKTVLVWDWPLRVWHWALAVLVLIACVTPNIMDSLHQFAGYAVMGLLAFRLVWGFFGTRHSRFERIGVKLRAAPNYLRSLFRGNTGRYLGLNPAGAVLLVAMLALLAISTVSGAMQVTVRFFGVWWVEDSHAYSSNAIIILAGLHVLGTILMSVLQRENLVRAMFTGRKQPAGSARPPQVAPSPERVPSRQQAEPDMARQGQRDEQDEGGPSVIPEFGSTSAARPQTDPVRISD